VAWNPARVLAAPDELVYVVRGKSFLRYMVRKIVGTLLDVGRGKLTPEVFRASSIARPFEIGPDGAAAGALSCRGRVSGGAVEL